MPKTKQLDDVRLPIHSLLWELEFAWEPATQAVHKFRNEGQNVTTLLIDNGGSDDITIEFLPNHTGVENPPVVVPAGRTKRVGPFPAIVFNDIPHNDVAFTVKGDPTSVRLLVERLGV